MVLVQEAECREAVGLYIAETVDNAKSIARPGAKSAKICGGSAEFIARLH